MLLSRGFVMDKHISRLFVLLFLLPWVAIHGNSCGSSTSGGEITTPTSSTETYSVGGTLSGLEGTVVLQNNSGENLSLTYDGSFAFSTKLNDAASYSVTVLTQPSDQTCSISSGSGVIASADVTNIMVVCSQDTYTVGGTVLGLFGEVILQNNSGDNLTVTQNGDFTFPTPLADGSIYTTSVFSDPSDQTCTLVAANFSGTINGTNITNKSVTCRNSVIVMFATSALVGGGNLGGRSGADTLCENEVGALSCNKIRAFISVNSNDLAADISLPYTDKVIQSP